MHRRTVAAVITLMSTGLLPFTPAPAGAAGRTADNPDPRDTHCLAEFDVVLSPGLSGSPSTGTFTSNGETGSIVCQGPIGGQQVTGIGTRGEQGRFGVKDPDTCMGGEVDFTYSFTIPTAIGPKVMAGSGTATYGPLQGGHPYGGTFTGDRMYGKFSITPIEGDCVTTPVTKVRLKCDEWVVNET